HRAAIPALALAAARTGHLPDRVEHQFLRRRLAGRHRPARGEAWMNAPDNTRLGERIRSLRLARGYTLKQLATLSGLSPSFVSMLETGRTGVAASRLQAIAEAFGLSAADLLPETGSQALIQTVRADRRPRVPGLVTGVSAEMLVRDLHRRIQPVLLT